MVTSHQMAASEFKKLRAEDLSSYVQHTFRKTAVSLYSNEEQATLNRRNLLHSVKY